MTEPRTAAGRALLAREALNSRSFDLIRVEDILAIEAEASEVSERYVDAVVATTQAEADNGLRAAGLAIKDHYREGSYLDGSHAWTDACWERFYSSLQVPLAGRVAREYTRDARLAALAATPETEEKS